GTHVGTKVLMERLVRSGRASPGCRDRVRPVGGLPERPWPTSQFLARIVERADLRDRVDRKGGTRSPRQRRHDNRRRNDAQHRKPLHLSLPLKPCAASLSSPTASIAELPA